MTLQGNARGAVVSDGAHLQFGNSTSTANMMETPANAGVFVCNPHDVVSLRPLLVQWIPTERSLHHYDTLTGNDIAEFIYT